jgi:shikimate kinase
MMGSGKSTVGPRLAERLGRPFIDTDHEVERKAGAKVAEIFAREGEAAFRARERAAVEALAGAPAVVSLGGGTVAQPGLVTLLAASGTIVYLRARPETLLRRVGEGSSRPLLRGLDATARLEKLRGLLAERQAHYERGQLVIDTDALDVESLTDEIARKLAGEEA